MSGKYEQVLSNSSCNESDIPDVDANDSQEIDRILANAREVHVARNTRLRDILNADFEQQIRGNYRRSVVHRAVKNNPITSTPGPGTSTNARPSIDISSISSGTSDVENIRIQTWNRNPTGNILLGNGAKEKQISLELQELPHEIYITGNSPRRTVVTTYERNNENEVSLHEQLLSEKPINEHKSNPLEKCRLARKPPDLNSKPKDPSFSSTKSSMNRAEIVDERLAISNHRNLQSYHSHSREKILKEIVHSDDHYKLERRRCRNKEYSPTQESGDYQTDSTDLSYKGKKRKDYKRSSRSSSHNLRKKNGEKYDYRKKKYSTRYCSDTEKRPHTRLRKKRDSSEESDTESSDNESRVYTPNETSDLESDHENRKRRGKSRESRYRSRSRASKKGDYRLVKKHRSPKEYEIRKNSNYGERGRSVSTRSKYMSKENYSPRGNGRRPNYDNEKDECVFKKPVRVNVKHIKHDRKSCKDDSKRTRRSNSDFSEESTAGYNFERYCKNSSNDEEPTNLQNYQRGIRKGLASHRSSSDVHKMKDGVFEPDSRVCRDLMYTETKQKQRVLAGSSQPEQGSSIISHQSKATTYNRNQREVHTLAQPALGLDDQDVVSLLNGLQKELRKFKSRQGGVERNAHSETIMNTSSICSRTVDSRMQESSHVNSSFLSKVKILKRLARNPHGKQAPDVAKNHEDLRFLPNQSSKTFRNDETENKEIKPGEKLNKIVNALLLSKINEKSNKKGARRPKNITTTVLHNRSVQVTPESVPSKKKPNEFSMENEERLLRRAKLDEILRGTRQNNETENIVNANGNRSESSKLSKMGIEYRVLQNASTQSSPFSCKVSSKNTPNQYSQTVRNENLSKLSRKSKIGTKYQASQNVATQSSPFFGTIHSTKNSTESPKSTQITLKDVESNCPSRSRSLSTKDVMIPLNLDNEDDQMPDISTNLSKKNGSISRMRLKGTKLSFGNNIIEETVIGGSSEGNTPEEKTIPSTSSRINDLDIPKKSKNDIQQIPRGKDNKEMNKKESLIKERQELIRLSDLERMENIVDIQSKRSKDMESSCTSEKSKIRNKTPSAITDVRISLNTDNEGDLTKKNEMSSRLPLKGNKLSFSNDIIEDTSIAGSSGRKTHQEKSIPSTYSSITELHISEKSTNHIQKMSTQKDSKEKKKDENFIKESQELMRLSDLEEMEDIADIESITRNDFQSSCTSGTKKIRNKTFSAITDVRVPLNMDNEEDQRCYDDISSKLSNRNESNARLSLKTTKLSVDNYIIEDLSIAGSSGRKTHQEKSIPSTSSRLNELPISKRSKAHIQQISILKENEQKNKESVMKERQESIRVSDSEEMEDRESTRRKDIESSCTSGKQKLRNNTLSATTDVRVPLNMDNEDDQRCYDDISSRPSNRNESIAKLPLKTTKLSVGCDVREDSCMAGSSGRNVPEDKSISSRMNKLPISEKSKSHSQQMSSVKENHVKNKKESLLKERQELIRLSDLEGMEDIADEHSKRRKDIESSTSGKSDIRNKTPSAIKSKNRIQNITSVKENNEKNRESVMKDRKESIRVSDLEEMEDIQSKRWKDIESSFTSGKREIRSKTPSARIDLGVPVNMNNEDDHIACDISPALLNNSIDKQSREKHSPNKRSGYEINDVANEEDSVNSAERDDGRIEKVRTKVNKSNGSRSSMNKFVASPPSIINGMNSETPEKSNLIIQDHSTVKGHTNKTKNVGIVMKEPLVLLERMQIEIIPAKCSEKHSPSDRSESPSSIFNSEITEQPNVIIYQNVTVKGKSKDMGTLMAEPRVSIEQIRQHLTEKYNSNTRDSESPSKRTKLSFGEPACSSTHMPESLAATLATEQKKSKKKDNKRRVEVKDKKKNPKRSNKIKEKKEPGDGNRSTEDEEPPSGLRRSTRDRNPPRAFWWKRELTDQDYKIYGNFAHSDCTPDFNWIKPTKKSKRDTSSSTESKEKKKTKEKSKKLKKIKGPEKNSSDSESDQDEKRKKKHRSQTVTSDNVENESGRRKETRENPKIVMEDCSSRNRPGGVANVLEDNHDPGYMTSSNNEGEALDLIRQNNASNGQDQNLSRLEDIFNKIAEKQEKVAQQGVAHGSPIFFDVSKMLQTQVNHGFLSIGPGQKKSSRNPLYVTVFYALEGECSLRIGHVYFPNTKNVFKIPKGKVYELENHTSKRAVFVYINTPSL